MNIKTYISILNIFFNNIKLRVCVVEIFWHLWFNLNFTTFFNLTADYEDFSYYLDSLQILKHKRKAEGTYTFNIFILNEF